MSKWSSAFRDSRWQKKRLEIMQRDGWACQSCGAKGEGVTLNVHHIYYESGKAPWEYPDDVLVTFCESCHKKLHQMVRGLTTRIYSSPDAESILELIDGFLDGISSIRSARNGDEHYTRGYGSGKLMMAVEDSIFEAIREAHMGANHE